MVATGRAGCPGRQLTMADDGLTGDVVPGERIAGGVANVAMTAACLAVLVALFIIWGWLIKLTAVHVGGGLTGLLAWCLVVFMVAAAVATLAGGAWATLQAPAVRRTLGRPRGLDAANGGR